MEIDLSKYHKGTDGLYYEDYITPDKAGTFTGKLVSTEWWHHGGTVRPDMQFPDRRRPENRLVRFPKIYRLLRPKIWGGRFQTCGKEHPLGV